MADGNQKHVVFVDTNAMGYLALKVAREMGHRVTFIRPTAYEPFLNHEILSYIGHCHRIVPIPYANELEPLCEELAELNRKEPIDALITTMELTVLTLAQAAERLGLPFTSAKGVETARRKHVARKVLDEKGIPSAAYGLATDVEDARAIARRIGYPVVVKPSSGVASVIARVVENEAELNSFYAELPQVYGAMNKGLQIAVSPQMLIEEKLVGDLISVEVARSRSGRTTVLMVAGRRTGKTNEAIEMAVTMPAELDAEQTRRAAEYGVQVVDALGLDFGIFHVEIMYTQDGPRLVECNPRLTGSSTPLMYTQVTGQEVYELLIRIHLGEEIEPPDFTRLDQAVFAWYLGARQPCRVAPSFDLSWLKEYGSQVPTLHLPVQPGEMVRRHTGNMDDIGFFHVVAKDMPSCESIATEVRGRMGRTLGIELNE